MILKSFFFLRRVSIESLTKFPVGQSKIISLVFFFFNKSNERVNFGMYYSMENVELWCVNT